MLDVVLIPGVAASTLTLCPLRRRLEREGFVCHWPGFEMQTAVHGELDLLARTVRELGSCALVGHSWGGLQAVVLALADNPYVRGVVGLGTPLWGRVNPRAPYYEARSLTDRWLPLVGPLEVRTFFTLHSLLPFDWAVQDFVVEKLSVIAEGSE